VPLTGNVFIPHQLNNSQKKKIRQLKDPIKLQRSVKITQYSKPTSDCKKEFERSKIEWTK